MLICSSKRGKQQINQIESRRCNILRRVPERKIDCSDDPGRYSFDAYTATQDSISNFMHISRNSRFY